MNRNTESPSWKIGETYPWQWKFERNSRRAHFYRGSNPWSHLGSRLRANLLRIKRKTRSNAYTRNADFLVLGLAYLDGTSHRSMSCNFLSRWERKSVETPSANVSLLDRFAIREEHLPSIWLKKKFNKSNLPNYILKILAFSATRSFSFHEECFRNREIYKLH